MKDGIINFTNRVSIYDNSNNLVITSNKITYDVNNQKILGGSNTEITDEFNNTYKVSEFEYSTDDKVVKLGNTKISDQNENTFDLEVAYLDLSKKEIVAKDIGLNFKISENSENEPRIKGRSLISDEKNTIVKKGLLHFAKENVT